MVTGAGGGIGRAIARRLAAAGARVIAADRRLTAAQQTADVDGIDARELDVTDSSAVADLIGATIRDHGALDVLVNNAGIVGRRAPLAELDEADFDRVMAVNVKGVFLGLRHGLPPMLERGRGAIVNVASVTAVRNEPQLGVYAASKHAVVALTRAAAIEAAPRGVRVNALLPGPTNTPMVAGTPDRPTGALEAYSRTVPLGRVSSPEEQAEVALFLASPRASFVTGEALLADGGLAYST